MKEKKLVFFWLSFSSLEGFCSLVHGLCFCWRAIEGVDQGTLRHVGNCLVFERWRSCSAASRLKCAGYQHSRMWAFSVRRVPSDARIGVTALEGGPQTALRPAKNSLVECRSANPWRSSALAAHQASLICLVLDCASLLSFLKQSCFAAQSLSLSQAASAALFSARRPRISWLLSSNQS